MTKTAPLNARLLGTFGERQDTYELLNNTFVLVRARQRLRDQWEQKGRRFGVNVGSGLEAAEPKAERDHERLKAAVGAELLHDVLDMIAHRSGADAQAIGYDPRSFTRR